MTLYEIAAGQPARDPESYEKDSAVAHQFDNLRQVNPDVPEGMAKIIEKACAFSPEERYQTAEELCIVLERFIAGKVPDRRRGKRKPTGVFRKEYYLKMVASVIASMLIFASGTLLFLWSQGRLDTTEVIENQEKVPKFFVKMFRESFRRASKDIDQTGASPGVASQIEQVFDRLGGR